MIGRKTLSGLVLVAIILPIVALVTLGVQQLLLAMNDTVGAAWLSRVALAASLLWVIDLVLLLLALGADVVNRQD